MAPTTVNRSLQRSLHSSIGRLIALLAVLAAVFAFAAAPHASAQSTVSLDQKTYSVAENGGSANIVVRLTPAATQNVTVNYTTAPGTAKEGTTEGANQNQAGGGDYTKRAGTLTFAPGETAKMVSVPIIDDLDPEANETFTFTLSAPANATLDNSNNPATITIIDNDSSADTIQFQSANYSFNESAGSGPTVTLTRTQVTSAYTIDFTVNDGTATAGSDYTVTDPNDNTNNPQSTVPTGNTGSVTFAVGMATTTIPLTILQDTIAEGNETFSLTLSQHINPDPNNQNDAGAQPPYKPGVNSTTVNIIDDDVSAVNFSAASYDVSKSASNATITVVRTGNTNSAGRVHVNTVAGSATADRNYATTSVDVTFAANQTAATFNVPIFDDHTVDGTVSFQVVLSTQANSGVSIGTQGTATVNIIDNQGANTVEFVGTDFSVIENDPSGAGLVTVRLNRGGDPNQVVTVQYFTSTGSATPGQDYTPIPQSANATLTFNAGETLKTFNVPIINDTIPENAETIGLNLANPTNAFLGATATATLTIQDDDSAGTVQFTSAAYNVFESAGSITLPVILNRTGNTNASVSVNYTTSAGSAGQARFVATSGTLTFAPGTSVGTITVPIINDTVIEPPQSFSVVLTGSANASLGNPSQAAVTIQDDDGLNTVQFDAANYGTVESGGGAFVQVRAQRGADPNQVLTVNLAFGGAGDSAVAGTDYTIPTSTTVTFPAGVSVQTVGIPVINVPGPQGSRTLTISLVNPGAFTSIGRQSSTVVTIFDDSGPNTVQFVTAKAKIIEGARGTIALQVVRFGNQVSTDTVVNFTTQLLPGDTAQSGVNFTATSGTVTFRTVRSQGIYEQEKVIVIPIPDNTLIQGDTTFHVTLTSADNANLGDIATIQVTVVDDDLGNVVQLSGTAYSVARSGSGSAVITVTRDQNGDASKASTVDYAATGITAFAGYDFSPVTGTLVFAPGETLKTFLVPINSNAVSNGPETFRVTLSNPNPGTLIGPNATAIVTIVDNNLRNTIQFSPSSYTVAENAGTVTIVVSVARQGNPNDVLTVNYATMGNTAVQNRDYTGVSGTVTFAAGQTQQTFTVPILQNGLITGATSFSVVLSNPSKGSVLGTANTAMISISDIDSPNASVGFSQTSFDASENGTAVLTVTRSGGLGVAVSVIFSTNDGTAVAGKNYVATTGMVSFGIGEISKTISIPLIDDQTADPTLQFTVNLTAADGSGFIGGQSTATVNIIDSDTTTIQFHQATYTVDEGAGTISLLVDALRVGDPTQQITVDYATGDGTATAPGKYTRTTGQLTFGPGVTQQTITVPIIDESSVEGTTTFVVNLSNPSSGTAATTGTTTTAGPTLGSPSRATVSIIDNDATTFQFSSPTYTATNSTGSVAITVNLSRINDPNGTFSVDFATSDVSAAAGRDYTATSGTLSFGPGETAKTVTVPIASQSPGQPTRQFKVTLSNPSAGSLLGSNPVATVNISNPDLSSKPVNISTRGPVETGDAVMIGGFIVQGNVPKRVLIRGRGPSLTQSGVVGALQDTTLDLRDSTGTQLAFNDNWRDSQEAEITATNLAPTDDRESAIVTTLSPGNYTAILRGKTNGVGLVEVFDLDSSSSSLLVNISTRSKIEVGDNGAMIGGFIIQGTNSRNVIIRASGPSLKALGVAGFLADPTLDLYRGSQKILSNDNWKSSQQAAIQATGLAPGNDKEAAILTTLDPGSYTAVVRGKNNTTGVALTEVFQLP